MISLTELRIGNWVSHKGEQIVVDSINDKGVNITVSKDEPPVVDTFYAKDISPIIITEKHLKDFGLKLINETLELKSYANPDIVITYLKTKMSTMEIGAPPKFMINCTSMRYVHQLQNLYFALLGKELKVEIIKP